jgi:hypothetical protein
MKNKLGWGTTDLRKPFDSFANEFQARAKSCTFVPGLTQTFDFDGKLSASDDSK